MTTKEDLLSQIKEFGDAVRGRELSASELEELADKLSGLRETVSARRAKHSFRELRGLGKEIWQDVDVDEYIRELRRSWR